MKSIIFPLIPHLVALFIRFIRLTYRFRFLNQNLINEVRDKHDSQYIYAIWHQNLLGGFTSHYGIPHVVIISPSKDGEIVATTCKKIGYIPVRGSSSRKGKAAIDEALILLKNKVPMANAVDGPRGPAHEVKRGVIEIAKKTQLPIVPISVIPKKYWYFKSWDKFRVPKPFTKIGIQYGQPIYIPKDLELNSYQNYCEIVKASLLKSEKEIELFFAQ